VTRRALLARLDRARLERAIAAAERGTSAELRVAIAGLFWARPRRLAERAFVRLGMRATKERNGVLLFVAPWQRRLELVADDAAATRVSAAFWREVVRSVEHAFRERRYTEGLEAAITAIGVELARHFPPPAGPNPNELPDRVVV
jgi:uncharacterized membrane protein